jgi:dUTP pyrophosphatase
MNNQQIKDKLNQLVESAFKIEVKVEEDGTMPTKAHHDDAGFDLYASHDFKVYPGEVVKHPLNIRLALPQGTWAEITSKSGLGSKGLLVYAGVIDAGYRGIPHVVMTNVKMTYLATEDGRLAVNTEPLSFKKGDKIAQLIMNPYNDQFYMVKVQELNSNTSRGEGGFGSTGVR